MGCRQIVAVAVCLLSFGSGVRVFAQEKLEFDVASVRESKDAGSTSSNVPLGPGDVYPPTGGVLIAKNFALLRYISFAYKMADYQEEALREKLPEWALAEKFNIEARTENRSVPKDQMRMMMRSLLAERFHLVVHYEERQVLSFGLLPMKEGVLGPKLQRHPADAVCPEYAPHAVGDDGSPAAPPPDTGAGGFPTHCGGVLGLPASARDRYSFGGRNLPMSMIAKSLSSWGNLGRPVVDRTGLGGNYDFVVEFTPDPPPAYAQGIDSGGPTFQEALKQQLGLKLEAGKAPVEYLVVDRVEHLREN
jgi:uncharacterized protein (TIGR03435 family)